MLGSQAHITILLVITLALANLIISGIGVGVTGFLARLTTVPYPIIGAVVIPIALLSTFVDTTSWRGIQIALGIGAMGLVMKRYNWPRPPMILGFILVDVIERNHFNAVSIHGYPGALTRPITIGILAITAVVVVVLLRAVKRMERETELSVEETSAGSRIGPGWKARILNPDVLIPLVVMAGMALMLSDHLQNPVQDRWRFTTYPFWLPVIALGLLGVELFRGLRGRPKASSIMDLGLVSGGEGARGAALWMLGMFALFLLIGTTVGLRWGALAFALAGPIVLLRGHGRWLLSLIAAAVVGIFIKVFLDNVLFVIYPEPFIRNWFTGG